MQGALGYSKTELKMSFLAELAYFSLRRYEGTNTAAGPEILGTHRSQWHHFSIQWQFIRLLHRYDLCLTCLFLSSGSLELDFSSPWITRWLLIDLLHPPFRRWWLGCMEKWRFIGDVSKMFSWDNSVRYERELGLLIERETVGYYGNMSSICSLPQPRVSVTLVQGMKLKGCLNISKWNEQKQDVIQPFLIESWPLFMDLELLSARTAEKC